VSPLPRPTQPALLRMWPAGAAGRAAWLGCLALLLALMTTGLLAPAWRADAAGLREQLATQRAERLHAADRARERLPTAPPAWPAAADEPARVRALLELAQERGVVVRALRQERVTTAPPGGARWQRLLMSADGSYPALRGFIEAALAADAALALDNLALQRSDATSATLRAELAWALAGAAP
jgi:hypothetical protein